MTTPQPSDVLALVDDEVSTDRVTAVLAHASHLVEAYLGRTYPDGAMPAPVASVVTGVAARALLNPGGLSHETSTTGPLTHGVTFGGDGLYLTRADKTILAPFRTSRALGGLTTVETTRGTVTGTGYVPTPDGAFPWYDER